MKKSFLLFLIMIIISSVLTVEATSSIEVGVNAGDLWTLTLYGDYSLAAFMLGVTSNSQDEVGWTGKVDLMLRVDSVEDTQIQLNNTLYVNGAINFTSTYDQNLEIETFPIIPANMNENDSMPGWSPGIRINDTMVRAYPSGDRLTNYFYEKDSVGEMPEATLHLRQYHDRSTGIVVEFNTTLVLSNSTRTFSFKIDHTNIEDWVIPEFSLNMILILFIIVSVITIVARRKFRRVHFIWA